MLRCKLPRCRNSFGRLLANGKSIVARKKSPDNAAVRRVPMREFSRSLPMSLLRAREAVMRQFRPSLRDHGLTEQQWRILRALAAIEAIEVIKWKDIYDNLERTIDQCAAVAHVLESVVLKHS